MRPARGLASAAPTMVYTSGELLPSWMVTLAPTWMDPAWPVSLMTRAVAKQDLKFLDAAFNESLLIFGSLIFGIFDQFAAFHGFMQALGDLGPFGAA